STDAIRSKIEHFEATDDVFGRQFLDLVILVGSRRDANDLAKSLGEYLLSLGVSRLGLMESHVAGATRTLDGPYLASSMGLYPVWKLLPDRQGAFVASVIQTKSGQIKYLNASTPEAPPNLAIAVPSRFYYPPRSDKSLHGLRVAIKDNGDIAGVRTCASSRAYGELYGPAPASAPAVQKLIDLGAVIVGKTDMSQFADAEDPTGDFVDFHAPWNPRGDGIRSPGGSSYGAGAATGAYDWLDFAIGTDTGGSVRQPAASQSVFGFRPSRGAASNDGTVVIHKYLGLIFAFGDLDSIGVLSKDFDVLARVSKSLFQTPQDLATNDQPTLIYPTHMFPIQDQGVQDIYEQVVSSLESVLGVKRRLVNLTEEWDRTQTYTNESYENYFAEASPVLYDYIIWGQYHGRAAFRTEYQAKFGRQPYVNPLTQMRWEDGAQMTEEHFRGVQTKREQFQSFIERVFGPDSFMVTPFKYGEPDARDVFRPAQVSSHPRERDREEFAWGLRQPFQSPMAGQPEIVLTGSWSTPTLSAANHVEEHYGVIASIIASKGTDVKLLDVTSKLLSEMKIPRVVLTGKVPFESS
ncbi:amidase signature domain-containing protein, partial [Apiosordaria backusii]